MVELLVPRCLPEERRYVKSKAEKYSSVGAEKMLCGAPFLIAKRQNIGYANTERHTGTRSQLEDKMQNRWLGRNKKKKSMLLSAQMDGGGRRGQTNCSSPSEVPQWEGGDRQWGGRTWIPLPDSCFCHYGATCHKMDGRFVTSVSTRHFVFPRQPVRMRHF